MKILFMGTPDFALFSLRALCDAGENVIPAFESKPVELYGGRYHFTALMDDGEVISWGGNVHGQADVPASVNDNASTI